MVKSNSGINKVKLNKMFDTYRPEGFRTVNSYLFVENPELLIDFLKNTFDAEEINRSINPNNGDIANCILKIGDSCFMISQAREEFLGMKTSLYLFVDNVDTVYKRAIENKGESVFEPTDMEYEDRQAGITDPSGNYWWISKRLIKKGYHE